MKNALFTLLFLCFVCSNINAQHEAKLNVVGLTYSNYTIGYEYVMKNNNGISIVGSSFTTPSFFYKFIDISYGSKSISGEYRLYFDNEKKYSGTGVWAGPYVKYNRKTLNFDVEVISDVFGAAALGNLEPFKPRLHKVALGLALGYKYVGSTGLIFGLYAGYGRNVYVDTYIPIVKLTTSQLGVFDNLILKDQLRFGINIGYRFNTIAKADKVIYNQV